MMKKIIFAILLTMSPALASSESSPVTKFLINDSVSMMDWGLFKLTKDLPTYKADGYKVGSSSIFSWEKNRLEIRYWLLKDEKAKAMKFDLARNLCAFVTRDIKSKLFVTSHESLEDKKIGEMANSE